MWFRFLFLSFFSFCDSLLWSTTWFLFNFDTALVSACFVFWFRDNFSRPTSWSFLNFDVALISGNSFPRPASLLVYYFRFNWNLRLNWFSFGRSATFLRCYRSRIRAQIFTYCFSRSPSFFRWSFVLLLFLFNFYLSWSSTLFWLRHNLFLGIRSGFSRAATGSFHRSYLLFVLYFYFWRSTSTFFGWIIVCCRELLKSCLY